ncbi:LysM peptidoglycan-binding domain-containing protein [Streptomyces fructofermentans]|uniref:Bacterial transcriptional activator domain-containing protein n=1 Tax=Streptomyces fructofermentans TaxID=152141 RepID=A0A918NV47_9ACTN|nr:LysM peptidoglycan-binding domain-containing protein [Streptomyces fructofermentans]GGX96583.1 hypothetical protein GCM10010515_73920 [Streptomyces fructofermentans]
MRTPPARSATVARVLGRTSRAVAGLLVLATAVAGLPLLLAWATPVIWASSHEDLTHLLDRQDTGAAFLLLLLAVGWVGWAQFTFCVVREASAQLRGRTWRAPRGMGSSQRAAALLIGSILVLLPASSALASDAQAAPATTAAPRLPGQTQAATHPSGASQVAPAAGTDSDMYTVLETRPAQSLWGIAERELGDGERWREIAALNEGRTMADGLVFRASSFLQPGWQLQMPQSTPAAGGARAQLGGSPAAGAKGDTGVVTVRAGDYLSKIAQEELGDGGRWPALFEASRGKPQPEGLPEITDPNVIHAGQQVTLPAPVQPPGRDAPPHESDAGNEAGDREASPPAAQDPGGRPPPDEEQAPAPSSTPSAPQSPAPSTPSSHPAEQPGQAGAGASPSASAEASGPAGSSPAALAPEAPPSGGAGSPALRTVLGAGALLAAAVTGALALRRTLQRRRRAPGERIAIAAETSPAEAQLAAAADQNGAARLDMALRTLAHHKALDDGSAPEVPVLWASRIGARTVEVLPEDLAHEPSVPFVSGKGGWWELPADAVLLDEEAAREVPPPCPGLVSIGSTDSGDLLLLNLARLPALLLDGNPVHITEMCLSLALELGMSPWASNVEVVTVGFGEDLPQLLPTARIAHMRHATHALRDLSERLLEAHQIPETSHQPYLLLCASALDPDTAWEFADVIDKAGPVPVTLVAPAGTAAAHFPEAEILNASLNTPQQLDSVGTTVTVQRLAHASYLQIATALKVSAQPAHPAEGPWQNVPDEPGGTPQPEQTAPKPASPAVGTAARPPTSAAGVDGGVFPALLTATTDPSRLLLATAASSPAPEAEATAAPASRPATTGEADGTGTGEDSSVPEAAQGGVQDLHAPEIRVLGPIEVTGVDSTGHGPRMAQLAALMFFRPARSADVLCTDMDPVSPWSPSTLNARVQGLRRSLGNDPTGAPYVPRRRSGEDPYRLSPGVRCDWIRFLHLAERALPLGPAGLPDLEQALSLVRGRPFGTRPPPWAEPHQQEMTTRIIDVAHTVATHRTPPGPHHDLAAARRAVVTGLDADGSAELLYRDWLRVEYAAGNRSGLHTAITRVQAVNRALDCPLEIETEQLIRELLAPVRDPRAAGS